MLSRSGLRDDGGKNSRVAAVAKAMAAEKRAERIGGKGRVVAYVLSVVFAALIGGGAWWWMQLDSQPQETESVSPNAENHATNTVQVSSFLTNTASTVLAPVTNVPPPKKSHIGRVVTNAFGQAMTIAHVARFRPRRLNGVERKRRKRIFTSSCERQIDALLCATPGNRFAGAFNADAFDSDFALARANKIEILPDDDPEDAERKRKMIEAKKMMEEAIASGGKASDVYLQARKEMNKLADIKDNTVRGLTELRRNGASEQEVEDYVEAANILLSKSGIEKGLMSPKMMKERFDEYLKKEDNK